MTAILHDYQKQILSFILKTKKCGVFLKIGHGKTLVTLSALDILNPNGHVLVIAPKNIARSTWIDEIKKWNFPFRYKSLITNHKGKQLSREKRYQKYEEILTDPPTIYFINRELIVDLIGFFVGEKGSESHKKRAFNYPIGWPFQVMIIDESQSFKAYNTNRFKELKIVSGYTDRIILLSGTPAPEGLEDLWSQIYLLDSGLRLGQNITSYRNRFFDPGRVMVNNYPVTWIPKPGAEKQIYDLLKDIVISMKNANLTLPPITYQDFIVHMSDEEKKIYHDMAHDEVLMYDKIKLQDGKEHSLSEVMGVIAANRAVLKQKLSQMANGALYISPEMQEELDLPEDKNCPPYIRIHDKKLEALDYIIENADGPVLVAYHFRSDRDMIVKYFNEKAHKRDITVFDGSPDMCHAWNEGKYPVMLLNPASAGHGLNIQEGGSTLVFYSIPWPLEHYLQTIGRLYRQGQKRPVVIIHLITEGTVDKGILQSVLKKDTKEEEFLDNVQLRNIDPGDKALADAMKDLGITITP